MMSAVSNSGGTWTYRLTFFNNPDTTGTCTFTVYAFGKPPTPTATIGFKVSKPSGELIFHSQFKPMRITSVVGSASGYTGPSSRDLAVLTIGLPMYGFAVFPTTVTDTFSQRVTGNVIQSIQTTVAAGGVPGFVRDGTYAAIDVTNY